jgi:hypothetical protein
VALEGVGEARLLGQVGEVVGRREGAHVGRDAAERELGDLVLRDADEDVAGLALGRSQQRLLLELPHLEPDDVGGHAEGVAERGGLTLEPLERLLVEGGPDGESLAEGDAGRGKHRQAYERESPQG